MEASPIDVVAWEASRIGDALETQIKGYLIIGIGDVAWCCGTVDLEVGYLECATICLFGLEIQPKVGHPHIFYYIVKSRWT